MTVKENCFNELKKSSLELKSPKKLIEAINLRLKK